MKKILSLFLALCLSNALSLYGDTLTLTNRVDLLAGGYTNEQTRYLTTNTCGYGCLIAAWVTEDGGSTWRVRVWDDAGTNSLSLSVTPPAPFNTPTTNVDPKALYLQECNGICYLIVGYADRDHLNGRGHPPCRLQAYDANNGTLLASADLSLSDAADVHTELFVGTPVCCGDVLYVSLWEFDESGANDWDLGSWNVNTNTMTLNGYDKGTVTQQPQLICCNDIPVVVYQLDNQLSIGNANNYSYNLSEFPHTVIAENTSSYSTLSCNGTCWVAAWSTEGELSSTKKTLRLWSVNNPANPSVTPEKNNTPILEVPAESGIRPSAVELFCCDDTPGVVGIAAAYQNGINNYLNLWRYDQTSQQATLLQLVGPENQSSLYVNTSVLPNTCIVSPIACANGTCGIATFDANGGLSLWTDINFNTQSFTFKSESFASSFDPNSADITRFGLSVSSCGSDCRVTALLPGSAYLSTWLLNQLLPDLESVSPSSCFCSVFNTLCAKGLYSIAAELYLHANTANRSCICTIDPVCAANVLTEVASKISYGPLLPDLCCYAFADNVAKILTILFSTTNDQTLVARLTNEVAAQGCCKVLARVLTSLTKAGPNQLSTMCTVLNNLEPNCPFCDIVADWFTQLLQDPLVGQQGASTLLAALLADSYCAPANAVLNCLCCSFTDITGIDTAQLIADALVQLQAVYNTTTNLFNCA